ncbi:MAG TPA: flavin reductase family protein [Peptococcaceae bacterium]|nr:flavin reductase family protein [Peptococcaceae bacterium]
MNNSFNIIQPEKIAENPFQLIGSDWMLITAGTLEKFNTMTAAWGSMGVLWNKKVCFIFVRPSRYTYEFTESNDYFTLSFFEERYRPALSFCGSKSGRDVDKIAATGLTPREGKTGSVYFEEAKLVIECRKIYYQDIDKTHFLDPEIEKCYLTQGYHRMYVGEIIQVLEKK